MRENLSARYSLQLKLARWGPHILIGKNTPRFVVCDKDASDSHSP